MKNKKKYLKLVALYLILLLVFFNFPFKDILKLEWLPNGIEKAEATQVTIDSSVYTTDAEFQRPQNTVFLENSTTGYVFGVDADGTCVYWKTTDSGITWGSAVTVYSGTDCLGTTVWYDRWTPGNTTGEFIHIAFMDDSEDDIYYERLDTSDDSQQGEVNATGSNQGGTFANTNSLSITEGTDGDLYIGTSDNSDSFVIKCTGSCGSAGNWTEAGSNPMDADEDQVLLRPLASGNIMLINWDISGHWIRSKIYTDSSNSWAGSWSNIIAATDLTSFKQMFDATINLSNNNLYFCNGDASSRDVFTGIYNGSSWSTSTATIIGTMYGCSLNYDSNTNYIWLTTYLPASGPLSARIFLLLSTDYMSSFTAIETVLWGNGEWNNMGSMTLNMIGSTPYVMGKDLTGDDIIGNSRENLVQNAYRWYNDNATSNPDSSTAMESANTPTTGIEIGQRLTARFQLLNFGSSATTTVYQLQYTTDDPTLSTASWTDVGSATAIAQTLGLPTNETALSTNLCGTPSTVTWTNGKWYENVNVTGSTTLNAGYYTEVAFMINTVNADVNTTYYLRLINDNANRPLNAYANYPTLTTVTTETKRYSKEGNTVAQTTTDNADYLLDELGYSRVTSDDSDRDTISAASQAPFFYFYQKNSNSTDQITVAWNGQLDANCDATKYMRLEVYRFGSTNAWVEVDTSTTCVADTDFNLSENITSNISEYYSSDWTYWRVWVNNGSKTIRTDQIAFTFTAAGSLTLSSPASTVFDSFTLGTTASPNKETWATGTEQILVSNSLSNGWTLSATCTDFTNTGDPPRTIVNDKLYFDSNTATSTSPTIVYTTYTGNIAVTEGADNQSFADVGSPVTIASAGSGEGIGDFYIQPSFDFYIYATSTYSGAYSATLTLTLAYNDYHVLTYT